MSRHPLRQLVYSALFLAIGIVLPIFTGNIPNIGASLLPMHIPVLLCGFICGGGWGALVGGPGVSRPSAFNKYPKGWVSNSLF